MLGKNAHINEFIDYYSKLTVAPEYALLIKGSWGCGKSHLVQQYIKGLENDDTSIKFLYVSLYGITSVEDIDAKFFELLNPVLSSKGMVLAGRFAKGLLKGALKIDLDGDGKSDGSMSVGIPDINLADYMTDTSNYVLVFDDLERCSMELKSILGYINYFVENDGYKVILIADEDKLLVKDDDVEDASKFALVKEKLIGKTLTVEADLDSFFEQFVKDIVAESHLSTFFEEQKDLIIRIFDKSGYGNLRSLRKTLLEFDRLWVVLDIDVKEKDELIAHLLKLFFILSLEIYSGTILSREIRYLIGSSTVARALEKKLTNESMPNKYKTIEVKYSISFLETIVSVEEWEAFFCSGHIDAEQINSSLRMTRYFSEKNTPDWIKLWSLFDLEDADFDQLYQSVRTSFDKCEYKEPGEIKHVSGMWLNFSRRRLITQSVEESLAEVHDYIDTVFDSGNVNVNEASIEQINGFSSYASLGYSDVDSVEFIEMSDHLNEKIREAQTKELAGRTEEVIDMIKDDPMQLYTLLCHSNYQKSPFSSRPILQYILAQDFMDLMMKICNRSKRVVAEVLSSRYEHQGLNVPLLPELPWLEEVVLKLDDTINNVDKVKPSTITFDYIKSKLDTALVNLRASQSVESEPK